MNSLRSPYDGGFWRLLLFYLEAVNVLLLVGGQRFVGQCPTFNDAYPDRFGIFFEFDELHRLLFDPFASTFVDDIDVITDSSPFTFYDHIMECAQFDVIGLEKLPHHVLVLLQGQAITIDIIVRIRFIQSLAPVQPSIVAIVPILKALLKPLSDRILEILTHYFYSFDLVYFLCYVNLGMTI